MIQPVPLLSLSTQACFFAMLMIFGGNRTALLYHSVAQEPLYCRFVGFGKGPESLFRVLVTTMLPPFLICSVASVLPLLAIVYFATVPGVKSACLAVASSLIAETLAFLGLSFALFCRLIHSQQHVSFV